jgi:sensor histidine kinase YesM
MLLTYQFPTLIFTNWNITGNLHKVTREGGWAGFLFYTIFVVYSRALLIAMAFTYAVIYGILPRIIRKKNWLITAVLLIFVVAATIIAQYFSSMHLGLMGYKRGFAPPPDSTYSIAHAFKIFFFNHPTVAALAVAIKLLKRWWIKQKETEQAAKEKLRAELQLLKAQIHPHFLFNSLNNIYSFTLEGSPKAPEMIQKLSGLLHYMLHECRQSLVPLEKELKMITDYISLEKIRYGHQLKIDVNIQDEFSSVQITPLLLIPFVENSFKHGTSKMMAHPYVRLHISKQGDVLFFFLTNSKPLTEVTSANGSHGLGLKNVKKRLELLYPGRHELQIIEEPLSYTVWLKIALTETLTAGIKASLNEQKPVYELA